MIAKEKGLDSDHFSLLKQENESSDTPQKRTHDLDAPLESAISGSAQVESSRRLDDVWAGTNIGQLMAGLNEDVDPSNTLLGTLQNLFSSILNQKKQCGTFQPKQFVTKLKQENEIFSSTMQQDAHEMFNYLINEIGETLLKQKKSVEKKLNFNSAPDSKRENSNSYKTWIHELFEGQLTNETKCLNCESITNRDEPFIDLSIDIEQNSSLSTCLRHFSKSEVLCHKEKFFCDTCNGLQEAEKRMKIKRLPNVLAVHLKRFKYQEQLGRFSKLSHRVCFTEQLALFNTADEAEDSDKLYDLCAIIVHIGSGPHHGHYVAVVKTQDQQWLLFDDEDVTPLDESDLHQYFGESNLGTGYLFIYNSVDYDSKELLKSMMPDGWIPPEVVTHTSKPTTPISIDIPQNLELVPEPKTPAIIASQELLGEDDGADIVPPLRVESPSNRLRPRLENSPASRLKPINTVVDTKRPSLPILNLQQHSIVPGPLTADIENQKDPSNGWGWFKKDKSGKNSK
ncbi:hypothetical protein BC833DRAFT_581643 [Globomyces pollinis-pini]|nr:hypothetical protein BC833DRAFT_581643 [Globomyces pollinis-pini]